MASKQPTGAGGSKEGGELASAASPAPAQGNGAPPPAAPSPAKAPGPAGVGPFGAFPAASAAAPPPPPPAASDRMVLDPAIEVTNGRSDDIPVHSTAENGHGGGGPGPASSANSAPATHSTPTTALSPTACTNCLARGIRCEHNVDSTKPLKTACESCIRLKIRCSLSPGTKRVVTVPRGKGALKNEEHDELADGESAQKRKRKRTTLSVDGMPGSEGPGPLLLSPIGGVPSFGSGDELPRVASTSTGATPLYAANGYRQAASLKALIRSTSDKLAKLQAEAYRWGHPHVATHVGEIAKTLKAEGENVGGVIFGEEWLGS